jgi:hypothetical protein
MALADSPEHGMTVDSNLPTTNQPLFFGMAKILLDKVPMDEIASTHY